MKKSFFFIIILLGILFFSGTDYILNTRTNATSLPENIATEPAVTEHGVTKPAVTKPSTQYNIMQAVLDLSNDSYGYQVVQRSRTKQLFERIDLSDLGSFAVFRNQLDVIPSPVSDISPIIVYEVQGPKAQGSLTYLAVKLKFIEQKDSTETINEVGEYGMNSFFFNDTNYPETAFLVVQIGDKLLAFQYDKSNNNTFDIIRKMVNGWMNQIKIN